LTVGSNHALGSGTLRLGESGQSSSVQVRFPFHSPDVPVANNIRVLSPGVKSLQTFGQTNGTYSGNISIENAAATFNLGGGMGLFNPAGSMLGVWTLTGYISGSGTFNAGGTWNLHGDNSGFSGLANVSGIIGIGSDTAFGTGNVAIFSPTLRADFGSRTIQNNLSFQSTTNVRFVGDNDLTFTGNVLLNSTRSMIEAYNRGVVNFAGVISGPTVNSRIEQYGYGMVTLSGANTFQGGYSLFGGVLGIGNDAALGSGLLSVYEGGVLRAVNGGRFISNNVWLQRNLIVDGDQALNLGGTFQQWSGSETFVINNWALTTISGQMLGENFVKEGSGVLTLTHGSSVFSSVILGEGTMNFNNPAGSAINVGSLIVLVGGTLGGSGAITGSVIVDGRLSPGDGIESFSVSA
jgi:hypothetical protein